MGHERAKCWHPSAGECATSRGSATRPYRAFGTRSASSAAKGIPLLWPWLILSALWIASVFFCESRDGKMGQELIEVFSTAFLPPLVPPLLFGLLLHVLAGFCAP